MASPSNNGFESVLSWLYAEREYQLAKFNYDKQKAEIEEDKTIDFWLQQFDSYIQRLPVFGLNTPQGIQACCKLAATAVALCEYLAETYGLPKPGFPSGVLEEWS